MLKTIVVLIGLGAVALAITPAQAQTTARPGAAAQVPNRATGRTGTHRTRERNRNTLPRQKARATSAHARQTRSAPSK